MKIELSLEQAKKAYEESSDEGFKSLLEANFGDLKPLPQWDDVKGIKGWFSTGKDVNLLDEKGTRMSIWMNVFATKEQARASIAMAMLSQMMKEHNEGWVPDWTNNEDKHIIIYFGKEPNRIIVDRSQRFLAFPTKEKADKFIEAYKDLIEQAKPLL